MKRVSALLVSVCLLFLSTAACADDFILKSSVSAYRTAATCVFDSGTCFSNSAVPNFVTTVPAAATDANAPTSVKRTDFLMMIYLNSSMRLSVETEMELSRVSPPKGLLQGPFLPSLKT